MRIPIVVLLAGLISCGLNISDRIASAAGPGIAATSVEQVDEDFAFQGEFSGQGAIHQNGGFETHKLGLQVAAQGKGEFIGVVYLGGLPGSGWDRETKFKVRGVRQGDQIELLGDGLQVEVTKSAAKLASTEKLMVGDLTKVERHSPTIGKAAPSNAVTIFDGSLSSEHLKNGAIDEEGFLKEGCEIVMPANDFTLHLEFKLPYMPECRGQSRANSGVYIHSRYEVQVLDSFALDGVFNECGALYRYQPPKLNMCLPPLTWQTYDILYIAPRFDAEGKKIKNAVISVHHNGVPVQDQFEIERGTGAGQKVGEGPNPLPIKLQNHRDPVRYRNIWMIPHRNAEPPSLAKR
ncbi:3-keto-disaccharide hydrolase [Thalassoroseus pseudoceratinae]|uniref:3-keto-disaccharide hydrolase n=1 Tax=Thalassoroseus pseudoceratinae TaxID=2713176 RepID=UPI0014215DC5|nr:DUF1080 domain-containing protein [Thalassoroseus pseudoceratinae]